MKFLLAISLFIVLMACRKEQPKIEELPPNNDPEFVVKGEIDGVAVDYQAGVNSVSIYHGKELRNGIKYTYSEMKMGSDIFRLGIFDGNPEHPLSQYVQLGDTLVLASKVLDPLATFNKDWCSNKGKIAKINWYVNGQLEGENKMTISEPGQYEVCGEYTFVNGETRSMCETILVGFTSKKNLQVNHLMQIPGKVKLWATGLDLNTVSSIAWKINGQVVSTEMSPNVDIPLDQTEVSAEFSLASGQIVERKMLVDGTLSGNYIEDFQSFVLEKNVFWDYAVGIDVKKNEKWYSTFNTQNFKSKLVINNISFYEINGDGDQVFRLSGILDAKVSLPDQSETFLMKLNFVIPLVIQ
jgi:hypothetical protein